MWELVGISLSWWLVSLSGVMMPGPVSAMAVTEGTRRGPLAGPLLTVGHAAAEAVMVALLVLGMSRALQQPPVVGTIGILGGAVLAWMGWGIAAAAWRDRLASPQEHGGAADRSLVQAGLLTTISNPYWLLWWATVGAAFFGRFSRFGPLAVAGLFFLGHVSLDLGWNSFLALAAGKGRRRFPPAAFRVVLGGCGIFLVGLSAYFVYSGVDLLTR
ncbi:MAG: LysE family transporter [Armatimonadota bacterium]|nr:LysE family transporter [Armatimonadota bacterium]MDR7428077.1 LysE family transporter [Armatimonadota bacterium]MDR7464589.1 LysE family transporter [Armatimonadota bacterium]MDR7469679.1 LysE family transporter [Armatimonadota bacterium]MDR7475891.1 LysE family transporter [Armatimonadota bacterium]